MRVGTACCKAEQVQVRCLVVDDNQYFLDAARVLLEREGMAILGVATTSAEALRLADDVHPDVVLVDICLGAESGLALAGRLDGTVILISTHDQSDYADEIAASPAVGFIPKARLSASAISSLVDEASG
jgi:DNA-binding NarL/FixJ family response regulator